MSKVKNNFKFFFFIIILNAIFILGGAGKVFAATHVSSITVSVQSGSLTHGIAGSSTYTVTIAGAGAGGLTVTPGITELPTGASGSFNPTTVTVDNKDSQDTTLTITTNSSTPAGITTFTIHNDNNTKTGTGTLTISEGETPIVATRLVINPVQNAPLGQNVAITIKAEDNNGNIDTTFTGDVTLSATGSVTGAGVVHLASGVGTINITDNVAETVTLSLSDTSNTGLNVDSNQTFTFGSIVAPPLSVGGGSAGLPLEPGFMINFLGKAFLGAIVNLLGIPSIGGNSAPAVKLDEQTVSEESGLFKVTLNNPDTKSPLYIISLNDKNRIPGQVKIFSNVPDVATLNNIIFAPTISLLRSPVRQTDFLSVSGSAGVGSSIEAQFDGTTAAKETTMVKNDGSYKLLLSTASLELGKHSVRVRSVENGKPSDFSLSRSFTVSALFNPEVDLNNDGVMDVRDINIFNSDWKSTDPNIRNNIDFNHDGKVDLQDLSIFTQMLKH